MNWLKNVFSKEKEEEIRLYKEMSFIPSPNFTKKRSRRITAIVLHHTGDNIIESTRSWFLDPKSGVSAHYLVGRNGEIIQMVLDKDKAWHAGKSTLDGKKDVNNFSIGIELIGDGVNPFTFQQYYSVAELCWKLVKTYNIKRIVSHQFIAPGRKTDPSPFDWQRFFTVFTKISLKDK